MPRVVKVNNAGRITFTEELVDPESDTLTLDEAIVEQKNGDNLPSTRQTPSWFDYNAIQNGDTLEVEIRIVADQINIADYTIKLVGSDIVNDPVVNRVELDVR